MSVVQATRRWRFGAVATVAAALALGGLASVAVHSSAPGRATAAEAEAVVDLPGAQSTQWTCAGPLPLGLAGVSSSIELTNTGSGPVASAVTFTATTGRPSTEHLVVVPGAPVVVRPPMSARGMAAARVLADGLGLSVVELVHGGSGPIAAPCTASTATTEFLVTGDTRRRDEIALSLYDPGSTPAVASVSFATASGTQAPPTFQGVPVGAGQLVVLAVADRLPFAPEVAMTVRSSGGSLAVGALDSTRLGGTLLEALEVGVQAPSSRWLFASAPSGPAAAQVIDLLNPSKKTAQVEVGYLSSQSEPKVAVAVPPGGTARVALNPQQATRALGAAEVTATNGVGVIAARELRIDSVIPQAQLPERNPTVRQRRMVLLVPRIAIGYTITGGAPRAARQWVVGGGESDKSTSELVTVTNPTARPATVTLTPAGSSVPFVRSTVVAPHAQGVVDFADLPAVTGRFAVVVTASAPVVASGSLYAKGSVGFTSSAAIPLD